MGIRVRGKESGGRGVGAERGVVEQDREIAMCHEVIDGLMSSR